MVVMNDTIKGDTMNALEILTSKSKALANNIKTIENAGYTMKFVDEFKTFVDSQRSVILNELDGSTTNKDITKYETQFIMEDNEGREVQVILSLVSKFDGRKLGDEIDVAGIMALAQAIKSSAEMNLDEMKVKIDAVYYSKGLQGWERSSFAGLENELDELSYF
tara:strand:- start:63 stop:554 length:492 start_codon:yes stop_codon:yes gene_type:complete